MRFSIRLRMIISNNAIQGRQLSLKLLCLTLQSLPKRLITIPSLLGRELRSVKLALICSDHPFLNYAKLLTHSLNLANQPVISVVKQAGTVM